MLRIAICDDEDYFRHHEKNLIEKYMKNKRHSCKIDLYSSGKALLNNMDFAFPYDVIFLDINMDEMDGMETAKKLRQISAEVYIVFVTAYITYALEGYKVDAVRYLLKEEDNLAIAMNECLDTITDRISCKTVMCKFNFLSGTKSISPNSILYVESRLHKVIFFVMEDEIKEYSMYDKLDAVELKLRQHGFFRIHQSFLVNMKYVKGVERYKISLKNGLDISISKKYYKSVETEFIKQQGDI